jgi:hypothetical protein
MNSAVKIEVGKKYRFRVEKISFVQDSYFVGFKVEDKILVDLRNNDNQVIEYDYIFKNGCKAEIIGKVKAIDFNGNWNYDYEWISLRLVSYDVKIL